MTIIAVGSLVANISICYPFVVREAIQNKRLNTSLQNYLIFFETFYINFLITFWFVSILNNKLEQCSMSVYHVANYNSTHLYLINNWFISQQNSAGS